MKKKILKIQNKGTTVEIGVIRLKNESGEEKLCFYFGDKMVLETKLSRIEKDIKKLSDYGIFLSMKAFLGLEESLEDGFNDIPVYYEPNRYGYQLNDKDEIIGYAFSNWKANNKNQSFINLAENKGNVGIGFLNSYIKERIERQVILLHQLSAPVGALDKHNHILVLAGVTSTGKTTIGNLTKSFFGMPDSHFLGGNMNATISALENEIACLYGVPYYMDDASLVSENFEWVNFLYRLANGETKKRASYKDPGITIPTKRYRSHFLISSENSILGKIVNKAMELDSNLEGILARVTEIEIEKNSSLLFASEQQLNDVVDFYEDNYGNLANIIIQEIFRKGVDTVKKEVRGLINEIIESNKIEDNLLKRKAKTIAIMLYTADIVKRFGLNFDRELIIKFMINQTQKAIDIFPNEKIYQSAMKKLIDTAREKGERKKDGSYYLMNRDYDGLMDELKKNYENQHFSVKRFNEYAVKKGALILIRDKINGTFTCNGVQGRGYNIKEVENL